MVYNKYMGLYAKQIVLFLAYLIFNIVLAFFLFAFEHGYLLVARFVGGGHVRDLFGIVYQLFNIRKILKSPPDIPSADVNTICCLVPVYNEDPGLLK